jgi:hypothetical protein
MGEIVLDRVTKVFDNGFKAIDDVSLTSATASSWCSSARPAAASRRCCG